MIQSKVTVLFCPYTHVQELPLAHLVWSIPLNSLLCTLWMAPLVLPHHQDRCLLPPQVYNNGMLVSPLDPLDLVGESVIRLWLLCTGWPMALASVASLPTDSCPFFPPTHIDRLLPTNTLSPSLCRPVRLVPTVVYLALPARQQVQLAHVIGSNRSAAHFIILEVAHEYYDFLICRLYPIFKVWGSDLVKFIWCCFLTIHIYWSWYITNYIYIYSIYIYMLGYMHISIYI